MLPGMLEPAEIPTDVIRLSRQAGSHHLTAR